MRVGPRRLTSTAPSSGESKLTVAAEWMTMSQDARTAASASSRPSPSVLTSPAITWTRRSTTSSRGSAPPRSERMRSKQSLAKISRFARCATVLRRPGRTNSTSSQSGTARSSRSTSAVPRNPVEPVTAIRLPARASAITGACLPLGKGPRYAFCVRSSPDLETSARKNGGPSTRERVLDAALASFAQRGYEATSLDALAAGLGVRKQTILYYHPSKDALLDAVVEQAATDLAQVLEDGAGRPEAV